MTPTFCWVFLLALVGRATSTPRPLVVDACALLCNPGAETESEQERDPILFPRYPKVNCKLQSESDEHQAWVIASHCMKLCNNELSINSEVNCFALRSSLQANLGCYCEALTPLSPNTMRLHESWRLNLLVRELSQDILNVLLDSPLDALILCEIHQELFKDITLKEGKIMKSCESIQDIDNFDNSTSAPRSARSVDAEEIHMDLPPAWEEPISEWKHTYGLGEELMEEPKMKIKRDDEIEKDVEIEVNAEDEEASMPMAPQQSARSVNAEEINMNLPPASEEPISEWKDTYKLGEELMKESKVKIKRDDKIEKDVKIEKNIEIEVNTEDEEASMLTASQQSSRSVDAKDVEIEVNTEDEEASMPTDHATHQKIPDRKLYNKMFSPPSIKQKEDELKDSPMFDHFVSEWKQVCKVMCKYENGEKYCQCKNLKLNR